MKGQGQLHSLAILLLETGSIYGSLLNCIQARRASVGPGNTAGPARPRARYRIPTIRFSHSAGIFQLRGNNTSQTDHARIQEVATVASETTQATRSSSAQP